MKIFDNRPQQGKPLSLKGMAQGWYRMAKAWETLSVKMLGPDDYEGNASIRWDNGQPTIEIYAPGAEGEGEGDPTNHYFLCEQTGSDSVKVRAGATQTIGGGEIEMWPEQSFDDLTESVWIYAHYKIDTGDWDTTGQGFLKTAATLPTSDGENDIRPIAHVIGELAVFEPYKVARIDQAHVGVLREPEIPPVPGDDGLYVLMAKRENGDVEWIDWRGTCPPKDNGGS